MAVGVRRVARRGDHRGRRPDWRWRRHHRWRRCCRPLHQVWLARLPLLSLLPGMPSNRTDSTLIVARACALNVSCCCGRPAAHFPPLPATPPTCLPRAPLPSLHCCRSIPVDFIEREKEYVLRADIPGVHKVGAWAALVGAARAVLCCPPNPLKRTRWVLRCAEHALPAPQGMLLSSKACALQPYTLWRKLMH